MHNANPWAAMASSLLRLPVISIDEAISHTSSLFGKSLTDSPRHCRHDPLSSRRRQVGVCAKFDLLQLMGGRGLCNGERGIAQVLKSKRPESPPTTLANKPVPSSTSPSSPLPSSTIADVENAFEKELLGLTGGFPGGEVGLNKFVQNNPPPPKSSQARGLAAVMAARTKPEAPTLPLLMPGMIVIVKNPANPYYMYCGIVQRITDGMVGVLFEGGNWDKLLTFPIKDLERREKGPPMVNPKSAVLEPLLQKQQEVVAAGADIELD